MDSREITVGTSRYRLITAPHAGGWKAYAVRVESGDRFGVEMVGATEEDLRVRLERWLEWQSQHTEALDALQHAERAYHRTVAGGAFVSPTDPTAIELQKEALARLEAARVRLDEIRARRPE